MSGTEFQTKLNELFPGSVLEAQFVEDAVTALKSAGFTGDNSIACVGVCRDELCDPFVLEVIARFGPTFGMRGLGGFISCGDTGFGAAHAHSPIVDGRQRFVYFMAPHIAIDEFGEVGLVQRPGIESKSTACGALCAFSAEIENGHVDLKLKMTDVEQSMLKQILATKLMSMPEDGPLSLVDLTKLAQNLIATEQLQAHINATVDTMNADYAIVTGIQIHAPEGKTYFYQVLEHCVTCIEGKIAPLVIGDVSSPAY